MKETQFFLNTLYLDCSSNDFLRVVSEYGLTYGLSNNYKGEANVSQNPLSVWPADIRMGTMIVKVVSSGKNQTLN